MAGESAEQAVVPPVSRHLRLRSMILGIVIFACGAVVGGVIAAAVMDRDAPWKTRGRERFPQRIAEKMQAEYGLTDEQKVAVLKVLEEHVKKLADIRAEVQPRVDAEHEALRVGIEAVLTPDQAAAWRKEYDERRKRWQSRDEGPQRPAGNP